MQSGRACPHSACSRAARAVMQSGRSWPRSCRVVTFHQGAETLPGAFYRSTRVRSQVHPRSMHAGMPVRAGEKWIVTVFVRQAAPGLWGNDVHAAAEATIRRRLPVVLPKGVWAGDEEDDEEDEDEDEDEEDVNFYGNEQRHVGGRADGQRD